MRAFRFSPLRGLDGTILVSDDGTRAASEADMEWFWRTAEPDLDRLTLELCAAERAVGNRIDDWLLKAELDAFNRTRKRAA